MRVNLKSHELRDMPRILQIAQDVDVTNFLSLESMEGAVSDRMEGDPFYRITI